MPIKKLPLKSRLERSLEPIPESGCWLWTKGVTRNGYGRIGKDGRGPYLLVHRAAYQIYIGDIPDGMQVNHCCDVKTCCNPAHLYLGTQIDNMRDFKARRIGYKNSQQKFSENECQKMVAEHKKSGLSYVKSAARYGVSPQHLHALVTGKRRLCAKPEMAKALGCSDE